MKFLSRASTTNFLNKIGSFQKQVYVMVFAVLLGFISIAVLSACTSPKPIKTTTMTYDDYPALWKVYNSLAKDGKYRDALAQLDIIEEKAASDKNDEQILKTFFNRYSMSKNISEDPVIDQLKYVESKRNLLSPIGKAITDSYLAELYQSYYSWNTFRINQLTDVDGPRSEEIQQWTARQILTQVSQLYDQSVSDASILMQDIQSFNAIVVHLERKEGINLRKTMFDLLAHRAIDYYSTQNAALILPTNAFQFDQEEAFLGSDIFRNAIIPTQDSASMIYKALQIFKKLENTHKKSADEVLIDIVVKRLNFAFTHNTIDNKDELYVNALEKLMSKYASNHQSTIILQPLIQFYINKAQTYIAGQNEEYKDGYIKAMKILENHGPTMDFADGKTLVEYYTKLIKRKELNITTELVNIPSEDYLIKLGYKNMTSATVKIYSMSQEDLLVFYTDQKPAQFFKQSNLLSERKFELRDLQDYQMHSIELPMPSLQIGAYFSVVEDEKGHVQSSSLFHVSNIGYAFYGNQWLRVFDRKQGNPLRAKITGYTYEWRGRSRQMNQIFQEETKLDGIYRGFANNTSTIIKVESGDDRLFLNNQVRGYADNRNSDRNTILMLTDRSIYRPGQKAYFKAIVYSQSEGAEPKMAVGQKVVVMLRDANYQEVTQLTLVTNEFGSINGEFDLPENLLNGSFQIQAQINSPRMNSSASIRVEEYKRPKFHIETKEIEARYSLDKEVTVAGEALSFTGAAISQASVSYKVIRTQPYRYYYRWYNPAPAKVIKLGNTETDSKGEYKITFVAESDKSTKLSTNPVFNYAVEVTITDQSGETHTQTHNVAVGSKELLINIGKELNIEKSDKNKLDFSVTNQNGDKADAKIKVIISNLEDEGQSFRKRYWDIPEFQYLSQPEFNERFPLYSYKAEDLLVNREVLSVITTTTINTADKQNIDLSELPPGIYKVTVSNDQAISAESFVTIYSKTKTPSHIILNATTAKASYEQGENVEVDIFTGAENAIVYVDILRSKKRIESEKLTVRGYTKLIVPVTKNDRGGILVKISSSIENRFVEQDLLIDVPYFEKRLKLRWETFRSNLYPGSEEKWKLAISDKDGQPVIAEVLTSMYDASLDQFIANQWRGLNFIRLGAYLSANAYGYQSVNGQQLKSDAYPDGIDLQFSHPFLQTLLGYGNNRPRSVRGARHSMRNNEYSMEAEEMQSMPSSAPAPKMQSMSDEVSAGGITNEMDAVQVGDIDNAFPSAENQNQPQSIRTNLNETVFFMPALKTNEKGELVIEFTMNEALTEWKLQTLATTKSSQFVLDEQKVTTSKDLMVFPNGPRFFREGDKMSILAKVQNTTVDDLLAKANIKFINTFTLKDVTTEILQEQSEKSIAVPAEGSSSLSWKIKIPKGLESLTYQISAETKDHKDGEENVAIVVTNRKLITESLAITLPANSQKVIEFQSLDKITTSKTLEKQLFQVSVTSNPSWLAVQSLPYLMEYQYNCSEQVFARYYGNKLARYILDQNPGIKSVYEEWKDKDQLVSALHKNEELKSAILEQTPWVMDALSEEEQMERMSILFDVARISSETSADLKTLIERQNGGGFPWFPGQRPNWYVTQHILEGIGQLDKMGVIDRNSPEIANLVSSALTFLDSEVIADDRRKDKQYLSAILIHYMYVRSFFPEKSISTKIQGIINELEALAEDKWKEQGLMSQGQLALHFYRKENLEFANRIMESLRQRTIYKDNLGRYWKEVNGYSWHNSNIETQAQLIVAFSEISKNDQEVDEMKQWLLSNKQTNSWKSTKATTQAIYALIEKGEKWINNDGLVTFQIAGAEIKVPDDKLVTATGQYEVKYREDAIDIGMKNMVFDNPNSHIAWASTSFQYWEDLDKVENYQETPLKLKREYYKKVSTSSGDKLVAIKGEVALKTGDLLTVRLSLIVDRPMEFIHLQDMRAAGTEPTEVLSGYRHMSGLGFYMETRDVATNFFVDYLPRGEYTFEYNQRVVQPGTYSAGISTIQSMYAPEFGANSAGKILIIE